MLKKIVAVLGVLAVVGLASLYTVGTVFAQGPTPPSSTPQGGWGGAWGRICHGAGVVSDAVTELLGMTSEQIYAERSAGKTLAEIAEDQGVSEQQVIDAMVAAQKEAIDQAVEDGRMTQAQADWMLAKVKATAPLSLSNPFGPRGGHGGRGGCGWHSSTANPTTQD